MVLPMEWVKSPKFFCALSETLLDMDNSIINTSLLVPRYVTISNISKTGPGLSRTLEILTYIYCYMGDIVTTVQGGPYIQFQVIDGTV